MYIPLKPLFSRHKGIGVQFTDEPTGNLDYKTGQEVLGLLRLSQRELGRTVVMVTHDRESAALCDRVVTIEDGRIVC